jgi:hypothetical protein
MDRYSFVYFASSRGQTRCVPAVDDKINIDSRPARVSRLRAMG